MDIARVNLAYMGCQEENTQLHDSLMSAFKSRGRSCPIYVDIRGPSIRLGRFPGNKPIELLEGKEIYITPNRHVNTSDKVLFCDFPGLPDHLKAGDRISIDYGRASLTVKRVQKESDVLPSIEGSVHVYPVFCTRLFIIIDKEDHKEHDIHGGAAPGQSPGCG